MEGQLRCPQLPPTERSLSRPRSLVASLGTTGHTAYAPEAIRTKLAAIAPNSPPQWTEKLQKSLKDRNATVIEDYYSDWREEV